MAHLTKEQIQATRIGVGLGLVSLLVVLAVISSIDITFADILDPNGLPATDSNVVFGLDSPTDLLNDPIIRSSLCVGLPFNTILVPDFSENSTVGTGTSWNATIPVAMCSSAPAGNEKHNLITQLSITAGEFLGTGVRAISVGYSNDGQQFGNLSLTFGIVSPAALQTEAVSSSPSCPVGANVLANGVQTFFVINADCVAFLASFPTWHIAFQISGNNENFPQIGNMVQVDLSAFGKPIEFGTQGQIQTDIFGTIGASTILAISYYSTALLSVLAAALILPRMTARGLFNLARGKK